MQEDSMIYTAGIVDLCSCLMKEFYEFDSSVY